MSFEIEPKATATIAVPAPVAVPARDVYHPAAGHWEPTEIEAAPAYTINHPPVGSSVAYENDFEDGTDGAVAELVTVEDAHSGAQVVRHQWLMDVDLPGTPAPYVVSAWVRTPTALSFGVTRLATGSADFIETHPVQAGGWVQIASAPVVCAGTTRFRIGAIGGGGLAQIDDVQITRQATDAWTETIPAVMRPGPAAWVIDDEAYVQTIPATTTRTPELDLSAGTISLDSTWAPYAQGEVVVPLESVALAEQLQPQTRQRVTITASTKQGSTLPEHRRTFDLMLRARDVDHAARTIKLQLESDEGILQEYAKLVDDKTPRTYEANLLGLVTYVLRQAIPGASLYSAPVDADLTARWVLENLVTNPRTITTDGYRGATAGTGAAVTLATSTTTSLPHGVTTRIHATVSGAAATRADIIYEFVRVSAGTMYTFSAYGAVGMPVAGTRAVTVICQWLNEVGGVVGKTNYSPTVNAVVPTANGSSPWVRPRVTAIAPAGAVSARIFLRCAGALAVGSVLQGGLFLATEGADLVDYFDGALANTSTYTYTWQGTANAATSIRTPDVERDPDMFTWRAGQDAWDFLDPILSAAGMRLWCDERRRWFLWKPETFEVEGTTGLSVENSTAGLDIISTEEKMNITGVIVRYRWLRNGVQQERVDTAGVAGKISEHVFERPYPGPGMAAAILLRYRGQTRIQNVTAATEFNATPGREVSIALPGAVEQVGQISRVDFDLVNGLMHIKSAGLTGAPVGTWLAGYNELAWNAVPDATLWNS